jgi:hypothetical protein
LGISNASNLVKFPCFIFGWETFPGSTQKGYHFASMNSQTPITKTNKCLPQQMPPKTPPQTFAVPPVLRMD